MMQSYVIALVGVLSVYGAVDASLSLVQHSAIKLHVLGPGLSTKLVKIRQAALLHGLRIPGEGKVDEDRQGDLGPRAAPLSEEGYRQVAKTRDAEAMKKFFQRVLGDMNLTVVDEDMLNGVVRYYSGDCATQTYDALREELQNSTAPFKCHAAWLAQGGSPLERSHTLSKVAATGVQDGWNGHVDEEHTTVITLDEYDAAVEDVESIASLVKVMVHRKGGAIFDEKKLVQFAKDYMNQPDKPKLNGFVETVNSIASDPSPDRWIKLGGAFAPLDEEGYMAIATGHVHGEMRKFILRVIADQNLTLVDDEAINGMASYYNGMCAVQSYAKLVAELNSVAFGVAPECGGGWVAPMSEEDYHSGKSDEHAVAREENANSGTKKSDAKVKSVQRKKMKALRKSKKHGNNDTAGDKTNKAKKEHAQKRNEKANHKKTGADDKSGIDDAAESADESVLKSVACDSSLLGMTSLSLWAIVLLTLHYG